MSEIKEVILEVMELACVYRDAVKTEDDIRANVACLKLNALIDILASDTRCEIVALCWLGRGDFATYAAALGYTTTVLPQDIAAYLADKVMLGDYLLAGITRREGL